MADRPLPGNVPDRPTPAVHANQRDKRVLVVEDDAATVQLLQRDLTEDGYQVRTAASGSDALAIVKNETPAVIITGWMMPGMNGLELCQAIRSQAGIGYVYILILTARSRTDHILEAFQAGVDDYVCKPFEPRELLARVRVGQRVANLVRANTAMEQEVAERKRAEEEVVIRREQLEHQVSERTGELLEAQRQLLQNEKLASVGQLAAGVAHEINTPIQYIGDNLRALSDSFADLNALVDKYRELVDLVRSGGDVPDTIRAIDAAERDYDLEYILADTPKAIEQGLEGVQRVAHIVRAMKDFSHVDREELSTIEINQALNSTLTVTRNEYKYVADVVTDFGELPMVACYASELNQVFLNVLVNAAHAIAETGERGTITITTRPDGDQVEIVIADTGTGIPEEIRDKIFDPFFTTKEVGKGTGQGLNIAHQIVVGKHGGSITVETEPGKGTTFRIRLPVEMERASTCESGEDKNE